MKSLNEYITESGGISDNEIWYRCGVHALNWMMTSQAKNIIDKYHISKSNPRAGIIRYMKDTRPPLPKDSEEFIHRSDWDLDSLVGQTEAQLMHKDYYKMAEHILSTRKPKSDVLTLFQCSSSKPYSNNAIYKNNYFNPYGDFSDFACISNPGIIPIDYSQFYPYHYDEWNIPEEEKLHELINMTQKYRIVNMCRFIRFVKKSGYKHVVVAIGNPYKQWIFDEMKKHNVAGCKDWMDIVTTDSLRTSIKDHHPSLGKSGGLLYTRTMIMPETRKKYERILRKLLDAEKLDDFNKTVKERNEHLKKNKKSTNEGLNGDMVGFITESWKNPDYTIMKSLDYNDFIKKFKNNIKDNMASSKKDKGSNNLYYKSYYWTALDLLLMAMDGNLLEDIDGEYWKFFDKLVKDKDFLHMGGFLFCYKPLMDNDDVTQKTLESEATDLKLIWQKPEYKLSSTLFN